MVVESENDQIDESFHGVSRKSNSGQVLADELRFSQYIHELFKQILPKNKNPYYLRYLFQQKIKPQRR